MEETKSVYNKLYNEVINTGLCTHCGTCVGLSHGRLKFNYTRNGPLPARADNKAITDSIIFDACPGKGLDYPELNENIFGKTPENWLIGNYENLYIGYSRNDEIRANAASAGIITHILIYLLEQGLVDGVVAVQLGKTKPWIANSVIALTKEDIIKCSQSVYTPVPVNEILNEIEHFDGKLAFVGLPDQVSSIRYLQQIGNSAASKIKYVIGPYVGTIMYQESLVSYLKSNGFNKLDDITDLKYRAGEWPGYMQIKTKTGRILKAEKFYYNYLIPFFVTKSSLLSVDFSNELTDISVGDAWHPKYEKMRKGFSVVIARSQMGRQILDEMQENGLISMESISASEAMGMHGHMFDFKKRGAFIRYRLRKLFGKKIPHHGYIPKNISVKRVMVEIFVSALFSFGKTKLARNVIEHIPIHILGPVFNTLRKSWKKISKPVKRKGLYNQEYIITSE